jgi:hypothetical protein
MGTELLSVVCRNAEVEKGEAYWRYRVTERLLVWLTWGSM